MLNLKTEIVVNELEKVLNQKLDLDKINEFRNSDDIKYYSSKQDFFIDYFNLKHQSWGELYDLILSIIKIENYSCNEDVLTAFLKERKIDGCSLESCLHEITYENKSVHIFITPEVIEACEKKEIELKGRMNSNSEFIKKAYELYSSKMFSGLSFKEFKYYIDNGTIVVFDNKKNFLDWYIQDYTEYKYVIDRMRELSINEVVKDIDTYIVNHIIEFEVIEFENCIIMDCELEKTNLGGINYNKETN